MICITAGRQLLPRFVSQRLLSSTLPGITSLITSYLLCHTPPPTLKHIRTAFPLHLLAHCKHFKQSCSYIIIKSLVLAQLWHKHKHNVAPMAKSQALYCRIQHSRLCSAEWNWEQSKEGRGRQSKGNNRTGNLLFHYLAVETHLRFEMVL